MPLTGVPLGRNCVLYLGDQLIDLENATPVNPEDVVWSAFTNVTDVAVDLTGSNVDITTRANASRGWAQEIEIIKAATVTFSSHWMSGTGTQEDLFKSLIDAALDTSGLAEISAWIANTDETALGTGEVAEGLASNFQVSFSQQQALQNVVLAEFTLRASSDTGWYRKTGV